MKTVTIYWTRSHYRKRQKTFMQSFGGESYETVTWKKKKQRGVQHYDFSGTLGNCVVQSTTIYSSGG